MKPFCQYMGCSYEFKSFKKDIRNFINHITYYSLTCMFFMQYAFKAQVHVFAGQVKSVSHSSCRTSAILKYFCPLLVGLHWNLVRWVGEVSKLY